VSKDGGIGTRFEGPEHSPGFLLWQVSTLWQRRQRAALEPLGLTHVQFVLLATAAWLARSGTSPTQTALAAQAKTDVMMTSQVIRALEGRGLVARVPHPTDTRAKHVSVTPEGQALVRKAMRVVEAADAAFFEALGDAKTASLVHAMGRLVAAHAD
jgi:DNA-binding MarR family transcriptional regulator